MKNTKIEWADSTWNPWQGCTPVSPGCTNCYASALSVRFGLGKYRKGMSRLRHSDATFNAPLAWNKKPWVCDACGTQVTGFGDACLCMSPLQRHIHRRRVFSLSLGDWLDDEVPIQWLADMLDVIQRCPNLDFLLLTKRPENWKTRISRVAHDFNRDYDLADDWYDGKAPSNVWIGASIENNDQERIPELLKIPAKVRFLSCEPLLGPVSFQYMKIDPTNELFAYWPLEGKHMADRYNEPVGGGAKIDWVIVGGESGPNARPMNPEWARSLRDQCKAAGVSFFMKQMNKKEPIPEDLFIREFPI